MMFKWLTLIDNVETSLETVFETKFQNIIM
jgi:hypothetical protein